MTLKFGVAVVWLGVALAGAQTAPAKPSAATPAAPASGTTQDTARRPLALETLDPATRADPFPAVDPKTFTASTPAPATVESYLYAVLGYDPNRIWKILAIDKTTAPGVSRVVVGISERNATAKSLRAVFFVLADQKHLIASDAQGASVTPFGAQPYADNRALVQQQATGPARGAAGKDLMLVQFTDLECAQCKQAETVMTRLAADFPQARLVYEPFPLTKQHPFAYLAASYGVCVAQKSGDAFATYVQAVYDTQAGLVAATAEQTLKAAAVKAGQDPAAIAACADTAAAKQAVDAGLKLGEDLGVDQAPTVVVNGRLLPLTGIPYETLKSVVSFQAGLDGVKVTPGRLAPTLK